MQELSVYLALTWQPVLVKMPAGHGPVPTKVFRAFIPVNQIYGVSAVHVQYASAGDTEMNKTRSVPSRSSMS